jgi:hypothetical protein
MCSTHSVLSNMRSLAELSLALDSIAFPHAGKLKSIMAQVEEEGFLHCDWIFRIVLLCVVFLPPLFMCMEH